MPELIDKSEVLKRLCAGCYNMGSFACISCVIPHIVKETPTVEAAPVRHGQWECGGVCSECGLDTAEHKPNFCPHCGAKMDGGEGNDS